MPTPTPVSGLMSQAAFARHRGVSRQAVANRVRRGLLPTYGPGRRINVEEADRLWLGLAARPEAVVGGFDAGAATAITQARTALVLTETQLRRLRLDERRGQVLDRQTVVAHFLAAMANMRAAFGAFPTRIGPELAADLGVGATTVMIALEPYVARQLEELSDVRLDLPPGPRR